MSETSSLRGFQMTRSKSDSNIWNQIVDVLPAHADVVNELVKLVNDGEMWTVDMLDNLSNDDYTRFVTALLSSNPDKMFYMFTSYVEPDDSDKRKMIWDVFSRISKNNKNWFINELCSRGKYKTLKNLSEIVDDSDKQLVAKIIQNAIQNSLDNPEKKEKLERAFLRFA